VNSKQKSHLRKQARRNRRDLTPAQRADASTRICRRIAHSRIFRNARRISFYLPFDGEVDCLPLLELAAELGKQVFLPQLPGRYPEAMNFALLMPETPLETGPLGTIQPRRGVADLVPPRKLDLVITPLVAFDSRGNRIGMGAGYYDQAFAFLKPRRHWIRPRLLGVGFDCQLVSDIKPDPWDVPLWGIVTETASYPCSRII
jgi:5-formyltetrahydrofolate cyclo-ligase